MISRAQTERLLASAALVLCAFLLLRPLYAPDAAYPPFDLIHFWRAGAAWAAGGHPYAAAFEEAVLPGGYLVRPFFYPPAARVFFEPLGRLSFEEARLVVALAALPVWGAVAVLTARALPSRVSFPLRLAGVSLALVLALPQVRLATEGGQVTPLVAAALAGLLWATRGGRSLLAVPCLFVLLLKPPLGVAVCLVLFLRGGRLRTLTLTGLAVALATLWGLNGDPALITGFLHNAARYAGFVENGPLYASGLAVPLHHLGLPAPSGLVLTGLLIVAAAALGASRTPPSHALLGVTCISLLLLPTHSYDYLLLVPFAPVLWRARGAARALVLPAGLVLAQASALAKAGQSVGIVPPGGDGAGFLRAATVLDTGAILVLTLGVAFLVAAPSGRAQTAGPAPRRLVRVPG